MRASAESMISLARNQFGTLEKDAKGEWVCRYGPGSPRTVQSVASSPTSQFEQRAAAQATTEGEPGSQLKNDEALIAA